MNPVVSLAQMKMLDRRTIEEFGIPSIVLMENAAHGVVASALEMMNNDLGGRSVWVFCGTGNNGGDGFAAARILHNFGGFIEVFLVGKAGELSGDAALNCDIYQRCGGYFSEVGKIEDFRPEEGEPDLIIDALLGTGFKGKLRPSYRKIIQLINDVGAPTLSVDIPSGVNGDSGAVDDVAVRADRTATMGFLKPGLLFPPGSLYAGKIDTLDIGIPSKLIAEMQLNWMTVNPSQMRFFLPKRSKAAYKGDAGYVYILAGSPGLTGAAVLASSAALRSGAGMVMTGTPRSQQPTVALGFPEGMTQPLPETADGFIAESAYDNVVPRLEWAHSIIIGPGLGRDPETARLLSRLIPLIKKPLVVDADGLNIIAQTPGLLNALPPGTILTPHLGEFSRLCGKKVESIVADRLEIGSGFAKNHNVVLVLKDAPTVTFRPDGEVLINTTGNAGMATAGSGDVLSGIIGGLLAQGMKIEWASVLGVFVHGLAGDWAQSKFGTYGMIAGDIVRMLPKAFTFKPPTGDAQDEIE